jgi:glycosyltransferase involved in cell wall biosynthesis
MLPEKIKLAFVSTIQTVGWGGSEELWALAAAEALDHGHEVGIFVYRWMPMPPRLKRLQEKGAKIFYRKRNYKRTRLFNILHRITGTTAGNRSFPSFAALKKFNPDVICITDAATWFTLTMTELTGTLRQIRKPYVIISQANTGSHLPADRESALRLFNEAHCIAFVSENNRTLAEHQLASPIRKSTVLQNPVNLTDLTPVPWPEKESPARLAVVARLASSEKGQDILFHILSRPEWQDRDYRLTLYGEGADKAYLQKLSEYYKISDKIEFAGQVTDIRSIWAVNHLYVLPTHVEGTPLSLMESMICGRPSVITNVGGNTEWVTEGVTGFIAESATGNLFGEALEKAWKHRQQWRSMGGQAHLEANRKLNRSPGTPLLSLLLDAAGQTEISVPS